MQMIKRSGKHEIQFIGTDGKMRDHHVERMFFDIDRMDSETIDKETTNHNLTTYMSAVLGYDGPPLTVDDHNRAMAFLLNNSDVHGELTLGLDTDKKFAAQLSTWPSDEWVIHSDMTCLFLLAIVQNMRYLIASGSNAGETGLH